MYLELRTWQNNMFFPMDLKLHIVQLLYYFLFLKVVYKHAEK